MVQYLLAEGLAATERNAQGGGPMSAAATMGHSEVLEELVAHKGDVEELDLQGLRAAGLGQAPRPCQGLKDLAAFGRPRRRALKGLAGRFTALRCRSRLA